MSEEHPVNRISFRADKQTELLNLKKNQFGHTVASESDNDASLENVKLRFGGSGTGVVAHMDLFDSPHLKKFIQDSDLDEMDDADEIDVEEIDLAEEEVVIKEEITNFNSDRPSTLEEFDLYANTILGVQTPAQATNTPKKVFASTPSEKPCINCNCKIKKDAKFCTNCGTPQTLAQFCKNCGNKFVAQENFCSDCGTKRG
jgi:hypothetical protein